MKEIDAGKSGFCFGPGENHSGPERFLGATDGAIRTAYDFLVYTDSRGMACNDAGDVPWALRIARYLEESGYSVLLVCRPKVLTVFITLINFLRANKISFGRLVTNLGFVDFTPKKRLYLDDISAQMPDDLRRIRLPVVEFPPFALSSGETENLYAYDFRPASEWIARSLESFFPSGLLLHALEASPAEKWPRLRPQGFFQQIILANRCLEMISARAPRFEGVRPFAELPAGNQIALSYDAVHLTGEGHEHTFVALRNAMENRCP